MITLLFTYRLRHDCTFAYRYGHDGTFMFFHVKASSGLLGMMAFMCTDIACIGMHTMVGMARAVFKALFDIQVWALLLLLLLL